MSKINLLPKEYQSKKKIWFSKESIPILFLGAAIVVMVAGTVILFITLSSVQKEVEALEQPYQTAKASVEELLTMERQVSGIKKELDALKTVEPGFKWAGFLDSVRQAVPEGIFLTEITGTPGGECAIAGESRGYSNIRIFAFSLEEIKIVRGVELIEVKLNEEAASPSYSFRLSCKVSK